MGLFPFIAQANGVANGALQHPRLVAFRFQALDAPGDLIERGADRRTDGAADHQPEGEFVRHVMAPLCRALPEAAQSVSHQTISENGID
ncbi:hypothetical protein D3C85_1270580 [compost metagenome]